MDDLEDRISVVMEELEGLFVYRDDAIQQPDERVQTPHLARGRNRRTVRIPTYLRDYITATLCQVATPSTRAHSSLRPHSSPSSPPSPPPPGSSAPPLRP